MKEAWMPEVILAINLKCMIGKTLNSNFLGREDTLSPWSEIVGPCTFKIFKTGIINWIDVSETSKTLLSLHLKQYKIGSAPISWKGRMTISFLYKLVSKVGKR